DTVSILDFGLARSEKSPNLTRHGEVLGTPNYMAPEVLRGGRALPSADVYSIGVMLFRILTGSLPFERDSPLAVAMAHLQAPVPVEKLVPPRVPEAIGNLVRRCLEKDAALRYDDARELGAALDRMSEDGQAPDRRHRTEKPFGKSQQITKILSFDELPQSVRDAVAAKAATPPPREDSGSGPVPKVDTKPIPIPADERPTEVVKPLPKEEPSKEAPRRLPVILIVDDDDDLRPLLVRILTRAGFTALAASSGRAALDTLYANEVDLILMDVMMPGMDGFDTLRVVRSQPRFSKVPVIMMSAAADQSRKAFAQQAGAVEYLQKPMEKGELVSRIWARLSPLGFGVPATPAP
ncbi:MAG: response regulator, partial [Acidobacteria bacterium]|nr:response regulator [Acidobacteriota bacterium]